MSMSESPNKAKQSFHEDLESNRLQWAATKFYPYTEDVFSLGLTMLQVAY